MVEQVSQDSEVLSSCENINFLSREQFIAEQKLAQITKMVPLGIFSTLMTGAILVGSLLGHVALDRCFAWFIVLSLVSVARLPFWHYRICSFFSSSRFSLDLFVSIGLLMSGVTWGASSFLLFAVDAPLLQALHVVILGGLVVGSMGLYAVDMRLFCLFSLPVLLMMTIKLISFGGEYFILGFTLLYFLVFTIQTARRVSKEHLAVLNLRFENKKLKFPVNFLSQNKNPLRHHAQKRFDN